MLHHNTMACSLFHEIFYASQRSLWAGFGVEDELVAFAAQVSSMTNRPPTGGVEFFSIELRQHGQIQHHYRSFPASKYRYN